MRPHQRFTFNEATMQYEPMLVHPIYGLAAWWVADNLAQFWYWFSHGGQVLHSPYLRFPPRPSRWRDWNVNHRLQFKWNLKAKLK